MKNKMLQVAEYIDKKSGESWELLKTIRDTKDKRTYHIVHSPFISFENEKDLCEAHQNGYQDALRDLAAAFRNDGRSAAPDGYDLTEFGKYLESKGWKF